MGISESLLERAIIHRSLSNQPTRRIVPIPRFSVPRLVHTGPRLGSSTSHRFSSMRQNLVAIVVTSSDLC